MKKYRQFLVSKSPRGRHRIGIDLGDIWWHYCDLNKNGEVIDRGPGPALPALPGAFGVLSGRWLR
jgi:hypothetical protein